MTFLIIIPAAIAAAAGMAITCAFVEGVICPAMRGRATRKRIQAVKNNRKPWPAWVAWLHS